MCYGKGVKSLFGLILNAQVSETDRELSSKDCWGLLVFHFSSGKFSPNSLTFWTGSWLVPIEFKRYWTTGMIFPFKSFSFLAIFWRISFQAACIENIWCFGRDRRMSSFSIINERWSTMWIDALGKNLHPFTRIVHGVQLITYAE
jgi:hypothetical protein